MLTTKRLELRYVLVDEFKSGPREGERKPFEIPDDAEIVSIGLQYARKTVVYYVVPAKPKATKK